MSSVSIPEIIQHTNIRKAKSVPKYPDILGRNCGSMIFFLYLRKHLYR